MGKIGYEIIALVESGDIDGAQAQIISECAPALDKVIAISQEIDLLTDEMMNDSVAYSQLVFFVGVGSILLFIIIAVILAMRIGKYIVKSITEPLVEVEKVAVELSEGNFAVDALVEWKGDFIQILDSIMHFEKSMASTVNGIQQVAQ